VEFRGVIEPELAKLHDVGVAPLQVTAQTASPVQHDDDTDRSGIVFCTTT
jgi:hypothetical protein